MVIQQISAEHPLTYYVVTRHLGYKENREVEDVESNENIKRVENYLAFFIGLLWSL